MRLDLGNLFHLISVSQPASEIRSQMKKKIEVFIGVHTHMHTNMSMGRGVRIVFLSYWSPHRLVLKFINNAENTQTLLFYYFCIGLDKMAWLLLIVRHHFRIGGFQNTKAAIDDKSLVLYSTYQTVALSDLVSLNENCNFFFMSNLNHPLCWWYIYCTSNIHRMFCILLEKQQEIK